MTDVAIWMLRAYFFARSNQVGSEHNVYTIFYAWSINACWEQTHFDTAKLAMILVTQSITVLGRADISADAP